MSHFSLLDNSGHRWILARNGLSAFPREDATLFPGPMSNVRFGSFNVWGAGDLLYAFYTGFISFGGDPGVLGAAFFIPTLVVPPLFVTHVMSFWLLLRAKS